MAEDVEEEKMDSTTPRRDKRGPSESSNSSRQSLTSVQQQQHTKARSRAPTSIDSDRSSPTSSTKPSKRFELQLQTNKMFMNQNASYSTPDLFESHIDNNDYANDGNGRAAKVAKSSNATALACIECRNRHLKCDGQPTCSRCQAQGQACVYQKSRRGYRARDKKNTTTPGARDITNNNNAIPPASTSGSLFNGITTTTSSEAAPTTPFHAQTPNHLLYNANQNLPYYDVANPVTVRPYGLECLDQLFSQDLSPQLGSPDLFTPDLLYDARLSAPAPPTSSASPAVSSTARETAALASLSTRTKVNQSSEKLRELYYQYFHAGHPVLPPSRYLKANPAYAFPPVLTAVVNYIGAAYVDGSHLDGWKRVVDDALAAQKYPDGYMVQALLLMAIAQNVHDAPEAAYEYLGRATDMALEIGMHREAFAEECGKGSRVLAEGWRRTYWEMYYIDALFAAVSQKPGFRLHGIDASVGLPGEEVMYDNCTVSIPFSTSISWQDWKQHSVLPWIRADPHFSPPHHTLKFCCSDMYYLTLFLFQKSVSTSCTKHHFATSPILQQAQ